MGILCVQTYTRIPDLCEFESQPGMSPVRAERRGEPAQLAHERDVLGYVPARVVGLEAPLGAVAALHRDHVRAVKKESYDDYHVLTFALGGAPLYRVDRRGRVQAALAVGTVAVQPAAAEAWWRSDATTGWLQLYLSVALLAECAGGDAERRVRIAPRDALADPALVRLLYSAARLVAMHGADTSRFEALADAIAERLLGSAASAGASNTARARERLDARQLAATRDYLAEHLGPGLTAARVAAALGMSRSHFSRAYAASTGETPYTTIQRARLAAAHGRVANGDEPLVDIATALGYASQAHMTDVFRARLGASPGDVRTLARGAVLRPRAAKPD